MRPNGRFVALAVAALVSVAVGTGGRPAAAQETAPEPREAPVAAPVDAYADEAVAELIERAREQRRARADGLSSFELTFRERIYAGLGGRALRRERAMFHQERAARMRWAAEGEHVIRWLGVRRGVPLVGVAVEFEDDPRDDDAFELDFDLLDPASEHVAVGSDWALHPLADTAALHYRYRSGDTLRIRLPGSDRTITLAEAIVEPREGRVDRIAGSLWFDADEAVLTRAAYRPAAVFDVGVNTAVDEDEDVPGFLRPIRAAVHFITIDYGLQELRWWLPNRMAFDAVATVADAARMPVRFEWTFDDYEIDGEPRLDPGEELPPGWTRWVREDDPETADEAEAEGGRGEERTRDDPLTAEPDSLSAPERPVIMIAPPPDVLWSAPELPEPLFAAQVDAFAGAELDDLRRRLSSLRVPPPVRSARGFFAGLGGGLRYNRVEGLSAGPRLAWPTGVGSEVALTPRVGIPELAPGAEIEWRRSSASGGFGAVAYHRLAGVDDWGDPFSLGNSLNSLLMGYDDGLYYRETGFEMSTSWAGARARLDASAFAERHRDAPKRSDASLPRLFGAGPFPDNLAAASGDAAGVSASLRAFTSVDPGRAALSVRAWGEAGWGDFDDLPAADGGLGGADGGTAASSASGAYGRAAASVGLHLPAGRWSGALEAGAGRTFGAAPPQRRFHLGGAHSLRAFAAGAAAGDAFWLGRVEVGRGFRAGEGPYEVGGSLARVVAFWDAAWAGTRDAFGAEGWRSSVGAGVSLMDGLLRIDLARGVRGGDRWRLHVYVDGLM